MGRRSLLMSVSWSWIVLEEKSCGVSWVSHVSLNSVPCISLTAQMRFTRASPVASVGRLVPVVEGEGIELCI